LRHRFALGGIALGLVNNAPRENPVERLALKAEGGVLPLRWISQRHAGRGTGLAQASSLDLRWRGLRACVGRRRKRGDRQRTRAA
jgi:hypothetical protein